MAVNPLPPQAYTKETLQKAYAWLLTQPSSVKELAHDQNTLIGLYLRAQRNGDAALDSPSVQHFKQELKSLAHMMGDFQSNPSETIMQPLTSPLPSHPQTTTPLAQMNPIINPAANPQQQGHAVAPTPFPMATATHSTVKYESQSSSTTVPFNINITSLLDSKSLSAIYEVQEKLNIGSESEALRILITLGLKNFKKLDL